MAKPVPIVDDYPAIAHRLNEITGGGGPQFTLPSGVEIHILADALTPYKFRTDTLIGLILVADVNRPKLTVAHVRTSESARGVLIELIDRLRKFYPSILTDRSEVYLSRDDCERLIKRLREP